MSSEPGACKPLAFLTTESDMTPRLPHLGVAVDKLTGLGGKKRQMAMLRANYKASRRPLPRDGALKECRLGLQKYTPGRISSGVIFLRYPWGIPSKS